MVSCQEPPPWKGGNTLSSVTPMMQCWWMHFPLCPWGWRQGVAPAIVLHIAGTWRGNPASVIVTLAVAVTIAIAVAISIIVADSVTIAIADAHCRRRRPLPLPLPLTIAPVVSVTLPSAIAIVIAIALAITHCCLHHCWPSQLQSLLTITVTVAIGHFQKLLPWRGKNCIWLIEAKNAHLMLFCFYSGWHTDQSRMTDQVSGGNGQHQRWVASGEQWAASEGSGWQQGGSRGAAGWRRWLTMGGVVLLCCWGISLWQMAFVMMCWIW